MPSAPTVLIVSTEHGAGHGAETILTHLLGGWTDAALRLHLLAPAGSPLSTVARQHAIPHTPLRAGRDSLVRNVPAAWRAARSIAPCSLVHAWTARAFDAAVCLGHRWSVPCSGTLHDHPRAFFHGHVRRLLMRQCAARFAGLAAVSQAVAEACRSARYRCPVRVVRNGLGDRPSSRSADPQVRIGFLAMHTPWKGFNVVARWVRPLAGENVRWLFYGDPAPESQAQVRALQAEFGPAVSLRGHQPATVIFDEIDVLVHASVEFDPLPTVLVEAARAGIPAVASCLGGAPEIVVDGRTGFLFDPSNDTAGCERVRELVRTPERRESMGRRARSRFESDFPLDRMLLAYRAFWTDLLGAPS